MARIASNARESNKAVRGLKGQVGFLGDQVKAF